MRPDSLARAFLALLALVLGVTPRLGFAQARPPIERLMREIQHRAFPDSADGWPANENDTNDWIKWTLNDDCDCPLGSAVPRFPPDNFFGDYMMDPEFAVPIVKCVHTVFIAKMSTFTTYLLPGETYAGKQLSPSRSWPTLQTFTNTYIYTTYSVPATTGSINADNYAEVVSAMLNAVSAMNRRAVGVGNDEVSQSSKGLIGMPRLQSSCPDEPCEPLVGPCPNFCEFHWTPDPSVTAGDWCNTWDASDDLNISGNTAHVECAMNIEDPCLITTDLSAHFSRADFEYEISSPYRVVEVYAAAGPFVDNDYNPADNWMGWGPVENQYASDSLIIHRIGTAPGASTTIIGSGTSSLGTISCSDLPFYGECDIITAQWGWTFEGPNTIVEYRWPDIIQDGGCEFGVPPVEVPDTDEGSGDCDGEGGAVGGQRAPGGGAAGGVQGAGGGGGSGGGERPEIPNRTGPDKAGDGGCGDCPDTSDPATGEPVEIADGHKLIEETDLVVSVSGPDFVVTRHYSSDLGIGVSNLLGNNWSMSIFAYLEDLSETMSPQLRLYPGHIRHSIHYTESSTDVWTQGGRASTARFVKATASYQESTVDVWRLIEPGAWSKDFLAAGANTDEFFDVPEEPEGDEDEVLTRDAMLGRLIIERDIYENSAVYEYITPCEELVSDPDPQNCEGAPRTVRLTRILLNPEYLSDGSAEAIITLGWYMPPSPAPVDSNSGDERWDAAINGKLRSLNVYRPLENGNMIATQRVEYLYHADAGGAAYHPEATWAFSADVGTEGDLVQVKKYTRMDGSEATSPYYLTACQYRYHDGAAAASGVPGGSNVVGSAHQLKSILMPEQIEYYAQKWNQASMSPMDGDKAMEAACERLLTLDDLDEAFVDTDSIPRDVWELAAKILSYGTSGSYSDVVTTQYLLAGCGCSGSAQSARMNYTYFAPTGYKGLSIVEQVYDGMQFVDYRSTHFDLEVRGATTFLIASAVKDLSGSGRTWVTAYEYASNTDPDRNLLTRTYTPAAVDGSAYVPTSGSVGPTISLRSSGLSTSYEYDSNLRLSEVLIHDGDSDPGTLVRRITYSTTFGEEHLASKVEQFRVAGSSAADDIETTWYEFGLRSNGSLAWRRTIREAELESENGPSTTGVTYSGHDVYDEYELYDAEGGRLVWAADADRSLTYYQYAAGTDSLQIIVQNADPSGPNGDSSRALSGADFEGLSVTGWGTTASGGELVSISTYDAQGRLRSRTEPSGVAHAYSHELKSIELRPYFLYPATISLPMALSGGGVAFDGPATVSWSNAAGKSIGVSTYTPQTSSYSVLPDPETPLDGEYVPMFSLNTELSRNRILHSHAGIVLASLQFHDVAGTGLYASVMEYDQLGRVTRIVDAMGTAIERDYDVLNRVIEERVGIDEMTPTMTTVREYYYDHALVMGNPVSGAGNGNLTLVRSFTGENGTLGAAMRDIERIFDERDRLVIVKGPLPPYDWTGYDNLDRPISRGMFVATPDDLAAPTNVSDRTMYSTTSYGQRGMSFRQRVAIDPTQSSPTYLETHVWRDPDGRPIAEWAPNAPASKRVYDGLGRVVTTYATDRGGDAQPATTSVDSHADADDVTGDIVLEQSMYTYAQGEDPWTGQLLMVTHLMRDHTATGTGAIDGTPTNVAPVATYTAFYYDDAARRIRTAQFGTNLASDQFSTGGIAPDWPPGTLPESASFTTTPLISRTAYDERGLVSVSTDPKGLETAIFYDDLSRRIAVVENRDDVVRSALAWNGTLGHWTVSSGVYDASDPSTDRVTSFAYDANSNVVRQVAHIPDMSSGETYQVTTYEYGTTVGSVGTTTNSLLGSTDLLAAVEYPDHELGGGSDSGRVEYSYNAQGELRSVTDQNGTLHVYERDAVGRITSDRVDTFGTDIDDTVTKLTYTYDASGRLQRARSYASTTPLNEVALAYTPLWQVANVFQNVAGEAVTESSGVLTVISGSYDTQYRYASAVPSTSSAGSNYSRLTGIRYPAMTVSPNTMDVQYLDPNVTNLAGRISRPSGIKWNFDTVVINKPHVRYEYLGVGTPVVVDYILPDVQLDRAYSPDGKRRSAGTTTQSAGVYPSMDRFGRVTLQAWIDGELDSGGSLPDMPPIVAEAYAYDENSNRIARLDARPGAYGNAAVPGRDYEFSYDGLNRLIEARRGIRVDTSTWSASPGSQKWALDILGNWNTHDFDLFGDGNYADDTGDTTETRTHNIINELTQLQLTAVGSSPQPAQPLEYDLAGNLISIDNGSGDTVNVYDAWNRLVRTTAVASSGSPPPEYVLSEHEYNALHWRTVQRRDTSVPADDTLDEQRLYAYSAAWQVLEEQIDTSYDGETHATDVQTQQFWGLRYIDDPVHRRVDRTITGGTTTWNDSTKRYHVTDAQFSTVAMIATGAEKATVTERTFYTPYGMARHSWLGDVDRDGAITSSDYLIALNAQTLGPDLGDPAYLADADLDRDGTITSTEVGNILAASGTFALPAGAISDPAGPDNPFGYCGYQINPTTRQYHVRFRVYDPNLGYWIQRDPSGTLSGESGYAYVGSRPLVGIDPSGLITRWLFPEAAIISWVAAFDVSKYARDTAGYALYGNPNTQRWYDPRFIELHHLYWKFYAALWATHNPDPPARLAGLYGPLVWNSKKHRGYIFVAPLLKCCSKSGPAMRLSLASYGSNPGYTDFGPFGDDPAPRHPSIDGTPSVAINGNCATVSIEMASRVGWHGQIVNQIVTGGVNAPYISRRIVYRVCCDGSSTASYSATHFPSHAAYLGGSRRKIAPQQDAHQFIFSGPNVAAMRLFHREHPRGVAIP
ncbi:MAG: RHS repeat-associated core domain-containing protein [Phycisphaerales bacterium]|jgi:RHS repeat-associated protein|nr:RHS repeat-associated core domain-containing protein [Phycisphaerales bacterium]